MQPDEARQAVSRVRAPLTPAGAVGSLSVREHKQPTPTRPALMSQQLVLILVLSLLLVLIERGGRGVPGETA